MFQCSVISVIFLILGMLGLMVLLFVLYVRKLQEQYQADRDSIISSMERDIEVMIKTLNDANTIIMLQKNILFYISDGIHNFGNEHFMKDGVSVEKEYFNNLNKFFSCTRTLADNLLYKGLYSKEECEVILKFIKEDFHDYFHMNSKELDLKKIENIIYK